MTGPEVGGLGLRAPEQCRIGGSAGVCQSFREGHHMHHIHAGRVGERPWGWRDGIVVALDGDGWLDVEYVLEAGRVRAWHHGDLRDRLAVGDPVRVHELDHALGAPFGWCNLWIESGLGSVPEPGDLEMWRSQVTVGVTDMATGLALPLDHLDHGHDRG